MAQQFLLMWSCFGTRVIRDMTLHSAPSFGELLLLFMQQKTHSVDSRFIYCVKIAPLIISLVKFEGFLSISLEFPSLAHDFHI